MTTEIDAIGQIDAILGALTDEAARNRVLDWAQAKYGKPKFNWTLQTPIVVPVTSPAVFPQIYRENEEPALPWTTIICNNDPSRTAGVTVGCATSFDPNVKTFWSDTTGAATGWTHLNPFS